MGDAALSTILSIELSRVCPGFMLAFGASMGLAGGAIMGKGTLEQKRRWGLPILTWDKIGAWGMTEPGAGSDAFRSMRTTATPKDGGYVLNGQKTFITNAPYADILVIYAKIDRGDGTPLADRPIQPFVVERGDAGVSTPQADEARWACTPRRPARCSSPTCFVPADRLLGGSEKPGRAGRAARTCSTASAPAWRRCASGSSSAASRSRSTYAKQRVTWGKPIAEYQLVQEKLAPDVHAPARTCENLMFKQLGLIAAGKSMTAAEASATKLYCARAATEVALEAVQMLGGNGYMQEYRVEMLMRDAKLLQIGGGTDEIQILNIARNLLGDAAG